MNAAAELLGPGQSGRTASLAPAAIRAGGVAVCGAVDRAGRVSSVNLGWDHADVGGALSDRLGRRDGDQ